MRSKRMEKARGGGRSLCRILQTSVLRKRAIRVASSLSLPYVQRFSGIAAPFHTARGRAASVEGNGQGEVIHHVDLYPACLERVKANPVPGRIETRGDVKRFVSGGKGYGSLAVCSLRSEVDKTEGRFYAFALRQETSLGSLPFYGSRAREGDRRGRNTEESALERSG